MNELNVSGPKSMCSEYHAEYHFIFVFFYFFNDDHVLNSSGDEGPSEGSGVGRREHEEVRERNASEVRPGPETETHVGEGAGGHSEAHPVLYFPQRGQGHVSLL